MKEIIGRHEIAIAKHIKGLCFIVVCIEYIGWDMAVASLLYVCAKSKR